MTPAKKTNRTSVLRKPMLLLCFAIALMWVSNASAGVISSSIQTGNSKIVLGCAGPFEQPAEDSRDQILQDSDGSWGMTRPASVDGPELPSATELVAWLSASASGDRIPFAPNPNLPASVPIELLKIPIVIAAI